MSFHQLSLQLSSDMGSENSNLSVINNWGKLKILFLSALFIVFIYSGSFAKSSSDTTAQKFSLGVLGGINIPDLSGGSGNPLSKDYSSRIGEAFGLTASYPICTHFALRIDALYSSEGGKRNGAQAFELNPNPEAPAGSYLYATFDNQSILNYFEVPVMLKYIINIGSSSKFYIDLGPMVGFLLNAQQKTSGNSYVYEDTAETMPVTPGPQSFNATTTVTSSINPVNFGFTGGIGIKQGVGFGMIFLDIRGAYGLTYVQKNIAADGNNHIGNLLFALGYSIPL